MFVGSIVHVPGRVGGGAVSCVLGEVVWVPVVLGVGEVGLWLGLLRLSPHPPPNLHLLDLAERVGRGQ